MTRTERLQLCRWAPEDFVSLEQVNENFTRLDAAGGSSQDAAEKTLSLRFTLSSSDTLVRECCGILL